MKRPGVLCLGLAASLSATPGVSAQESGHDGGFSIASEDFRLGVSGFLQFRWVGTMRDDPLDSGDLDSGFEIRRLRLTFEGSLYDDQIGFKISNSFSRSSGEDTLSDGYVTFAVGPETQLKMGQFKLPFLHETLTSAKRQLAVDRSLTNSVFTLSRSQGLELEHAFADGLVRVAVSDGGDQRNTAFEDDDSDLAISARLDAALRGELDQFHEFSGFPGQSSGWMLGVAAHYEEASGSTAADGDITAWSVDSALQGDGWSAFIAYVGRSSSDGNAGESAVDHGVVAQASMFVREHDELFARYDVVLPDDDRAGDDPFHGVTVGFNHYLYGHAAKFSVDVQYFPTPSNDNDLVGSVPGVGFLDSGDEGDEVVVRAQFQLLF